MKTLLISTLIVFCTNCYALADGNDEKAIEATLKRFSKAADEHNLTALSACLDDQYRIVMNQLFGSKEISIVSRDTYLQKIKSKEWGGDKRTVAIERISVIGNNAQAQVIFQGQKMTFISLISLVKDSNGDWKLINDTPTIK